jgi:hypothetical protein
MPLPLSCSVKVRSNRNDIQTGKSPIEVASYRPISLLPIMANKLIPPYRFGFRENHSTAQQCHRIINKIRDSLEAQELCASVFLDVQQAFDKVWHEGLSYKLKSKLPNQLHLVQVKIDDNLSDYHLVKAGVPQRRDIGPSLYLIYTADAPTRDDTVIATFADDTIANPSQRRLSFE